MIVVPFEGETHKFPDGTSDDAIVEALKRYNAGPTTADVIGAIPGEAKRQMVETVSGAAQLGSDIGVLPQSVGETSAGVRKEVEAERQLETPKKMNLWQEGLYSGGASVLGQGPAMIAAGLAAPFISGPMEAAKVVGGVTTAMGMTTGLQKYGETRDAMFGPTRSGLHALFHGLVEKYTEYLPLKDLVGKPIRSAIYSFLWKEATGEQIATLLQDFNDKISTRPEMTLGDYLHDAAVTAIAVGVSAPIQAGAVRTMSAAMAPFIKPENITPEQKAIIDAANVKAGGDLGLLAPQPTAPIGAVQAQPPMLDITTLPQPPEAKAGTERVYTVIPSEGQVQPMLTWTSDLAKVQQMVSVMGPNVNIPYVDMTPAALAESQKDADIQTIRTEQQVAPTGEYVLPSDYITSGNALYTAPPQPAAPPTPSPGGLAEGTAAQASAPIASQVVGPTPTPQPTAKPKGEPTLIWRNDEKGVKIKVVFPDEASKMLYLYHNHVTKGAADYATQNQLATERDALSQSLGIPPNLVAEYAKWYNANISSNLAAMTQNGTMRPQAFNLREYQEQKELVESPTVRRWKELANSAEAGTVNIAPDLPQNPHVKRAQAFLQKWMQLFTPGAKMVIADIAIAGKNVAAVRRVDGVTMIRIPSVDTTKFWATFALAHEFGHHIFLEVGNREEHAQAMAELRMEWETLKAQVPNMTAEEFIDKWMAPSKMVYKRHVYETLGVKASDPATMLAQAIDAKRNPGDALSFDEYVAEQFARYVLKHHRVTISDQLRDFFKEAVDEVRAFFDKIVYKISPQKRFEQFVDSLRTVPPTQAVYDAEKMNLLAEDSYFDTVDEMHEFTTRVLARLPKKDKINRITIIGELARPDVKDQERKLFNQVLDTFDGDVIDRSDLNARVMEKIIPITVQLTQRWGDYGLRRIGVISSDKANTIIFDLPFDISKANHFNDSKYFGHARWFEDTTKWSERAVEVGRVRSIVELQSDLAQKDRSVVSSTELNHLIDNKQESVNRELRNLTNLKAADAQPFKISDDGQYYEYRHELFMAIPEDRQAEWKQNGLLKHLPNLASYITYIDPKLVSIVRAYIQNDINQAEVNLAELSAQLQNLVERRDNNVVSKVESLPKRWWEFMLRKLNHDASVDGVVKMRMASADTVAKVEGWPTYHVTQSGDGRWSIGDDTGDMPAAEFDTREEAEKSLKGGGIYGRNQGLYNRYANEITKFVKREFGAKEISEGAGLRMAAGYEGNTWLEWDVKPNLQNVPIEYYDLVDSMDNASKSVSKLMQDTVAEDVPSIPGYFEKFQWFFHLSLQLNQMAKMLPHVQPLQTYRRLMQSMANLKNTLMSGPNQRIKEWYSLSKRDSIGVQDMLRAEVDSGQHWTKLEKHQVVVAGKPMDMWIHVATEKVAAEAKARGLSQEAINVYMGVKNDFLTTLGTMEQTLIGSIEEYFKQNPIAGSARQAVVRTQFQQFRETPWTPDRRFGQWSVIVRAREAMTIDGQEVKKHEKVYFSGHRRQRFQKAEYARLQREYGSQYAVTMEYIEDLPYVMRSLPREFIRMLPEQLQLSPEQMSRFEELYYDVTKEGRYYKLFTREKKGIGGAEQDIRQSYSDYMWRTANLISKMAYGRKLQRETYTLNRLTNVAAKNGGSVVALRRLHEYMVKNYDYVMRPQHEWEQLRAIVSLWYLWGVPKTALMNATTIVTTTYPRLAAIGGDLRATREIIRAMKDVSLHWKNPTKVSNEVAALFAQGRADGVTNQSFAAELAAVADGNAIERIMPTYAFMRDSGVKDRVRKYTWKMIHWGMMPFRVTEEFNRRVTLLAAYRMERIAGKPGLESGIGDGSAYLAARDTVDFTQNEYAPWNRAKFLQGKKSVALIFFSFMQNMSFFMFGGDKGWWRGLLVLAALSGLQGLPGAENVIDFLNWLGRKVLNEPVDLRVDAREMATAIGVSPDYVMHGAMHSMFGLGWDTANSVGMGRVIPGTDAIFGQGDANQRIMQMAGEIGGPFGSLSVAILQALFDDNPNMLIRFDRALPPLVRNIERGYRGATENQWVDSKGRALVDEASGLEVLGQLTGFAPTSKTKAQEMLHAQREQAQFYVLRRQNLMSALFQATQAQDTDAIADAKEHIRDYNDDVPDAQLRITAREMQQSLRARQRSAAEVLTSESATKRYRPIYERVGAAFPQSR